jgi:putative ABC transport system ATP-binding protein
VTRLHRPAVRLSGVAKTYPGIVEVRALHPTDLCIDQGEFLAVVGPSGSGKSTLLNVIGLLDRPSAGRYEFCGADVSTLRERERTALRGRRIGFVFQSFHLLAHRTATENVALAQLYVTTDRKARSADAVQALRTVGLGHRLDALPPTMSGGERQRVAIARALVNRPDVVLCDEPTGNLDSRTSAYVMTLLEELNASGLTVIVITHDLAVAERAKRVITIRDGRIITDRRTGE